VQVTVLGEIFPVAFALHCEEKMKWKSAVTEKESTRASYIPSQWQKYCLLQLWKQIATNNATTHAARYL
jgi:hypothetical protein